eukprot:42529-Prymnesium_polylepis.1
MGVEATAGVLAAVMAVVTVAARAEERAGVARVGVATVVGTAGGMAAASVAERVVALEEEKAVVATVAVRAVAQVVGRVEE